MKPLSSASAKLRRQSRFLLLAAFFCCLWLPRGACAVSGDEIIQKVQAKFKSLKALSVRFEVSYPVGGDSSVEVGRLYLDKRNRFRMETAHQTIISDGKTIWSYSPRDNQVIVYHAEAEESPFFTPDQLLFDFAKKYRVEGVSDTLLGDLPCYLLQLAPKDETDPTRLLQVWVDKKEYFTRRFRLEDLAGNVTVFGFRDFVTGKNLPDSTFQFIPPKSAEVIDTR